MLISEKRLRKLIIEEITSEFSGPIDDDSIIISDDNKCFFGSRRRDVPPGRLRTTGDGRGFALNDVMVAIMDHPSLAGMRMTDLDWEIMDEEWFTPGSREAVSVVGRGCFKDCSAASGTSSFRKYCQSLESDEDDDITIHQAGKPSTPSSDTGSSDTGSGDTGPGDTGPGDIDFEPIAQQPQIDQEILQIEMGDRESLLLGSIRIRIDTDGKIIFNDGDPYRIILRNSDGDSARMKLKEMTKIDDETVNVVGEIGVIPAELRKDRPGDRNIDQNLPISSLLSIEDEINEEDTIEVGVTLATGDEGFIIFRR